ncbi:hypothetical protein BD626DRAFT_464590, partial [Schizophyllum amplum]
MTIYARICYNATGAPPHFRETMFERLPDIWKWARFMNPLAGSIADDVLDTEFDGKCWLRADGEIAMPTAHRLLSVTMFLGPLIYDPRGVRALAVIPDLPEDMLGYLCQEVEPSPHMASIEHRFALVYHHLLHYADAEVAQRFRSALEVFDDRCPGLLICTVAERLSWFFDPTFIDPDNSAFVFAYSRLVSLDLLYQPRVLENLRSSDHIPLALITRHLISATANPDWARGVPHQHFAIRIYGHILIALLVTNDVQARAAHADVVLVIRSGLLTAIRRLLSSAVEDIPKDARQHAIIYETDFTKLLIAVIVPAINWPDGLRACKYHVARSGLPLDAGAKEDTASFLLFPLAVRFTDCCRAYQEFRKVVKHLRGRCGECKRQATVEEDFKMCVCGTVFYCSKACQRAAWGAGHSAICYTGRIDIR